MPLSEENLTGENVVAKIKVVVREDALVIGNEPCAAG